MHDKNEQRVPYDLRDDNSYYVSEILKSDFSSFGNKKLSKVQNNLFGQMNISKIEWCIAAFYKFFYKKIIDKTTAQLFLEKKWMLVLLTKWITIPREDSKTSLANNSYGHTDVELFAKRLAYYFLTPINNRDKIWEIWHEIFTMHRKNVHCLNN